ncbi:malonyl-CoA decarboxylase [Marivibrio halodurans]|nr:malonyl-CoA decarboxylase [Marivibrio halodurans]
MTRATSFFNELIGAILDRRPGRPASLDGRPVETLCADLLSSRGEISSNRIGAAILDGYRAMDEAGRRAFFGYLTEALDLDPEGAAEAARRYAEAPTVENLAALERHAEPRRQELFRRLNHVPGATAEMVAMRRDLIGLLKENAALRRTDHDLQHLLRSWFNRGFLVLRPISWRTPAHILEKVIAYEAVHAITSWEELRRRLEPSDRRCFAFFHPSMPDEPLVFVEVALTRGIPGSIQAVLSDDRQVLPERDADTAVFYSISNCQAGLRGISFGNSLIKQVVADLSAEMPWLKTFVTLSPVPGFNRWLDALAEDAPWAGEAASVRDARRTAMETGDFSALEAAGETLRRMAAHYLFHEKRGDGLPLDPVARFHLGNGAMLHAVHALADRSGNGLALASGVMVNYLYDLGAVERNHEDFAGSGTVATSRAVRELAGRAPARSQTGANQIGPTQSRMTQS